MRPALLLATLAAVLGGCAVPAVPPERIEAAIPPAWHAPLPHGGDARALANWWRTLGDAALGDLIEAAQAASPDLASARARIEQARAARAGAGAALLPTLDGTAAAARGNAQAPFALATTVQAGALAAWEIDLLGGNEAAARAADARLRAARAGWHAARVTVAAEVAGNYFSLRSCQRQLEVTAGDARSRGETARLTQLSADAGFTAPAVAALGRATAAEAAARLKQQQAQCELEIKTLVALTAWPEPALRERLAGPQPAGATATPFAISALPAEVLSQRPDLIQAELAVAAASADVGAARADLYPRLSLSGSIAAGLLRTGGASQGAQTWSIGPLALSVPLFDGGRRTANVEAAQARYHEAAALYQAQARRAVAEVERALIALSSAQARGVDAEAAARDFRISFEATEARYRTGLASLVELEDARRNLLAAQTALVGLQRELQAAWVALYRAAGGGWDRDLAAPAGR